MFEISASLFPLFYIEFWVWNELILINCSNFFAIVYYVSVIYVSDVNLYYKNQIINYFFMFFITVLGEALNNFKNDNINYVRSFNLIFDSYKDHYI